MASPAKSPASPSKSQPGSPAHGSGQHQSSAATAGTTSPAPATSAVHDPTILPASHWQQLPQPEVEIDDADSGFVSVGSSTDSLSSSIMEYRIINGRTYHGDRGKAAAWEPNDEAHLEAQDIAHHLSTLLLDGRLCLAPIKDDVQKVLDIGTGTGIWAIDFGDAYPSAEVIGTDLSPCQPAWVPPNVKFEIDDANEEDWTWADKTFDFIHNRALQGCIVDWNAFYREAFRVCKPGGYVEGWQWCMEFRSDDGSVKPDSAMAEYIKLFHAAGRKSGRSFRVVEDKLEIKAMEAAGFVDIVIEDVKCPCTAWPRDPKLKEVGKFTNAGLTGDLEGWIGYVSSEVMGWTKVEVAIYCAHLRAELKNSSIHAYFPHQIVYARKPE